MKLILFGGVQGVGKTTLLAGVLEEFSKSIKLVDSGEFFRRYFYKEKLKTIDEIEDLIVDQIIDTSGDSIVLAHWHYAVSRPQGYIPQIDFSRVKKIAASKKIDQIVLISIEASIDTIYGRRVKDSSVKKRNLNKDCIFEEIKFDNNFLKKHEDIFLEFIDKDKISIQRINNVTLSSARAELRKLFKKLLSKN